MATNQFHSQSPETPAPHAPIVSVGAPKAETSQALVTKSLKQMDVLNKGSRSLTHSDPLPAPSVSLHKQVK